MPGELELGAHLGAVERALRDDRAAVAMDGEHVGGEAGTELGGEGGGEAHGVDREAEEHDVGLLLLDRSFEGRLVEVVLELVGLDRAGEDLVDALDVERIDQAARVARDEERGRRAAEFLGRAHELERDRPQLAPEVLRDDERSGHYVCSDP